jgi:hypothetical protein
MLGSRRSPLKDDIFFKEIYLHDLSSGQLTEPFLSPAEAAEWIAQILRAKCVVHDNYT